MNLRRLKYFIKIVDIGSLTQAADVLHIAQPALSQQLATLEAEMGQKLVHRNPRCVTATEAGKALYRHASAFIFPSHYEGFGLPPLEAMACGCPVLASTAEAVRETCGDAALYFDPRDAAALAMAIDRLSNAPALADTLRERALARLAIYSWERNARLHFDLLSELL